MRLVIQRVESAKVTVNRQTVGKIDRGLFVLVGVGKDDDGNIERLAKKLINLRIMKDDKGKMNRSVKDVKAELLVVSQFTLHADTKKGNRPSFIKAADPKIARKTYEKFVSALKDHGVKVETGEFGSYMEIDVKLDGPVTILI